MSYEQALLGHLPAPAQWPSPPPQMYAIPMQTRAWMQARATALAASRELRCFAVHDGEDFQGLAPFTRIDGWLRELPALFEPSDLVWSSEESLQQLASMLAAQPLPLYLERVPGDSPTLAALRRAYAGRGLVLTRPAMPTPYIELDARWQDFDRCFNAGRRSDFRRAERRAREFGEPSYELHAPGAEAGLAALLDEAYAVEARSWKQQAGTSLTADTWQGRFFRRFAREAAQAGMLRIAFLRLDGRVVAAQIAAEWQQRFWLFKISHDQAYARCSPGQLLIRHTLHHAAESGLHSYEFMGVMDDWTRLWTNHTRRYLQIRAFPFSVATGRMLLARGARALSGGLRRVLR